MAEENRYAQDWNQYSRAWEAEFGGKHQNLGDEWNDQEGAARKRDDFYFSILADRFLSQDSTVLEVGPGGGKWSVRMAPRVKKLICIDVAQEMLDRTEKRCREAGLTNVEFVLGNAVDFQPLPADSIDFFFSFDVFVHIALEDTFPYIQEMNRVLKPGGRGVCHHAIGSPPQAFNRIELMNDWYRGDKHTLGKFYYYSPESLRRMYEHCGLQVHEQYLQDWHCSCIFTKPANSVVPRLEELLRQLISPAASDPQMRQRVINDLRTLPRELDALLAPILDRAQQAADVHQRATAVADIRKSFRGLSTQVPP